MIAAKVAGVLMVGTAVSLAALVSGLSVEGLLTGILTVDLAQFAATLDHRGRIASVEAAVAEE